MNNYSLKNLKNCRSITGPSPIHAQDNPRHTLSSRARSPHTPPPPSPHDNFGHMRATSAQPRVRPHACKPHRPGSILVPSTAPSLTQAPAPQPWSSVTSRRAAATSHDNLSRSSIPNSSKPRDLPPDVQLVRGAAGSFI
jgi:hypothetical protein